MHTGKDDIQFYADAFQRGEERGFEYFFNELYPALLFYAFRMLKDRQKAEEVVGDSFIKVWEHHETLSHPRVIKSYLYTTVRNTCINRLQQEKRNKTREQEIKNSQGIEIDQNALHQLILSETIREIHASIASLPTACQAIFKLLYIEGKSVREVAEQLKLSISTVKNQKARGIKLLRERFPELCSLIATAELFAHH